MHKIIKKIEKKYIYILTFIIPLIILYYIFKVNNIYPFGEYAYIKDDTFFQYYPFLKGFGNNIKSGNFSDYSWNIGLGSNYLAIFAYYLASPVNFVSLLFKSDNLIECFYFICFIKMALSGVTFAYYLRKKYNHNDLVIVCISICYSMSSYMCTYAYNIMWLDALVLFPLIILGLERLFDEGKHRLYFFTLMFSIISNYYISIIICIYLCIYVVGLFIINKSDFKEKLKRIKDFIIYSLLAGLSSMFLIIPSFLALRLTESGSNNFPTRIKIYNSFSDLMFRHLMLVPKGIDDSYPNLYCSVLVLITITAYILNNKIELKKKLVTLFMLCFMLISMNVNMLDYIWHGFHFPNCVVARNSFIYIFILLTISYEAVYNINDLKNIYYIISVAIAGMFVLVLWKLKINTGEYDEIIVYLSMFFVVVYSAMILLIKQFYKFRSVFYLLILIALSYELFVNAKDNITPLISNKMLKTDCNINELINKSDKSQNDSFGRIYKDSIVLDDNLSEKDGYYGISVFSSTANSGVTDFYKACGMECFTNIYGINGITPFFRSLMDVEYIYSQDNNLDITDFEKEANELVLSDEEKYSLYQNKYPLSLGFLIDSKIDKAINLGEDVFKNINDLYIALSGDFDELYEKIDVKKSDGRSIKNNADANYKTNDKKSYDYILNIDKDGSVYVNVNNNIYISSLNIYIERDGEEFISYSENYVRYPYNTKISNLKKGDKIYIGTEVVENHKKDYDLYAYYDKNISMEKLYDNLKDGFLNIREFKDGYVKGSVNAKDNGYLFTTIPYDQGWKVYIDGKEVKTEKMFNAFLTFKMKKGNHDIVMKYSAPGKIIGLIISLLAIIAYIILEVYKAKKFDNVMKNDDYSGE
ncbi:Uncharacterized membrane protein YfhO [Lachnospiraceae bacterium RM5]|nr:Uncharacterized membrane protein YfhO [Lachnospiraceae bacterium RM5]